MLLIRSHRRFLTTTCPSSSIWPYPPILWGSNIGLWGLACTFMGARVRSCCDVVLAGKSVEDWSAANLVAGQVGHVWGLDLGLGRRELRQRLVWPRCVEMVQVVGEDPA